MTTRALTFSEAKQMAQDDADKLQVEMVVVADAIGRRNAFSVVSADTAKADDLHVWSRHQPVTTKQQTERS